MRVVKFRLFHRGRMHSENFTLSVDGKIGWTSITGLMEGEVPEAIMQFTGLHDKNGNEIYEGDIIRRLHPAYSNEKVETVKWTNTFSKCGWNIASGKNLEVIGNIYENPELLK